jgi:hypothetical protein
MHPEPGRILKNAAAAEKTGRGKGWKRTDNPSLHRKSLRGNELRHGTDRQTRGRDRPPSAPRGDTSSQSIPPLDFFTPLASMWFSPLFSASLSAYPRVSRVCCEPAGIDR